MGQNKDRISDTVGPLYSRHLATRKDCPDYKVVLNSGIKSVLYQSIVKDLVPVPCVYISEDWIRGVAL